MEAHNFAEPPMAPAHHMMMEDSHFSHYDDHPRVQHPPILNIPHPYVITSNEAMGPEDEHFSKEKNTQSIAHVPHVEPPVMIHPEVDYLYLHDKVNRQSHHVFFLIFPFMTNISTGYSESWPFNISGPFSHS